MTAMPSEVRDLFEKVDAVTLATANADGQPNACIVGMKFVVDDETLYLSDQFFNKTLANVLENDKVAVVFWGEGGAYQIHGTARYVNEGSEFEERRAVVDVIFEQKGRPYKCKGGIFVDVESVYDTMGGPNAGKQIA